MLRIFTITFVVFIAVFLLTKYFEKQAISSRKSLKPERTYEFMGSTMNYRVLGEGQSVVLVHGAMLGRPWNDFDKKLAEKYKVYLPDLPGFGASAGVSGAVHNTDLFASTLCEFIKIHKLQDAPIVGLSMGALVVTKVADQGCANGKLILIGAAGEVSGIQAKLLQSIPRLVKRIVISTYWGKDTLLIPVLNANIGSKNEKDNSSFIADLETTDPRSIVDIDYFKEQNEDFPSALERINNEKVFIYGEYDVQKGSLPYEFLTLDGAGHNIFATSEVNKVFELINAQIDETE